MITIRQNTKGSKASYEVTASGPKTVYPELLNRSKLADRIVPTILQYIKDRGLREGDKLPPQKELCDIMGVGSCSLREALIVLQVLGVLKSRQGMGWYIDRFEAKSNLSFISHLLEKFGGIHSIEEIMETRLMYEPSIACMAAQKITPEGLERLGQSLAGMKENRNKPGRRELREADREFHRSLFYASCNNVLSIIGSILSGLLFDTVLWAQSASNDEEVMLCHEKIYDAVAIRDGLGAGRAMKQHLVLGWKFLHANHIIATEYAEKPVF